MTKKEWDECEDPLELLTWLSGKNSQGESIAGVYPISYKLPSDRKFNLFALSCLLGSKDKLSDIDYIDYCLGTRKLDSI